MSYSLLSKMQGYLIADFIKERLISLSKSNWTLVIMDVSNLKTRLYKKMAGNCKGTFHSSMGTSSVFI
jgi:hypothetical protein